MESYAHLLTGLKNNIFGSSPIFTVEIYWYFCYCGKVVEKLDFVETYTRIITRLAEAVSQMCEHMSIDEVVFRLKNC